METLGYLASLIMGIALGLMGGGGSILTVPILVYLFKVSAVTATVYSLFIVGSTALIGSSTAMLRGDVDFKTGLFFAAPSMVGVHMARAWLVPAIPDVIWRAQKFSLTKEILVMATFAVLMVAASRAMIRSRHKNRPASFTTKWRLFWIAAQALVVGLVAGFVGAGGGFLIVPALVTLTGLPMRTAVGTSLLIIALQSLSGFVSELTRGLAVESSLLGSVSVFAISGIFIGSAFAQKFEEQKLKKAFGWFVLLMGTAIFVQQILQLSSK